MKTFEEYLAQQENLFHRVKDFWDSIFDGDNVFTHLNKIFERLFKNHKDDYSWAQLIKALSRLNKKEEANVLALALSEGEVFLHTSFDPRIGFFPEEVTFTFRPSQYKLTWASKNVYNAYSKFWTKNGNGIVTKISERNYRNEDGEVQSVPIYGFTMKHPARENNLYPDQRSGH